MENTSQLLQRHEDIFSGPDTLVVDLTDPALGESLAGASLHTDLCGVRGAQAAPLPVLGQAHRRVVIILPKSGERLEMLLQVLAGQRETPLETWLVGPTRGGIRGGVTRLGHYADEVEQVDSARHCKLFRAWLRPGPPMMLGDFARCWHSQDLELVSYPGVFSHARVDEGTLELLPLIDSGERPVLDMGCGYGLLTAALARSGARVTAVDRSTTAVAATRSTLAANDLTADVHERDLYQSLPERFREIWTNPPFHEGTRRTLDVTGRLIRQAPEHLSADGVLTLVCNHGLAYEAVLQESFRRVELLRQTRRFLVYRAWR